MAETAQFRAGLSFSKPLKSYFARVALQNQSPSRIAEEQRKELQQQVEDVLGKRLHETFACADKVILVCDEQGELVNSAKFDTHTNREQKRAAAAKHAMAGLATGADGRHVGNLVYTLARAAAGVSGQQSELAFSIARGAAAAAAAAAGGGGDAQAAGGDAQAAGGGAQAAGGGAQAAAAATTTPVSPTSTADAERIANALRSRAYSYHMNSVDDLHVSPEAHECANNYVNDLRKLLVAGESESARREDQRGHGASTDAGAGAPPPLDSESVNKTTQSSPSFFVAEGLQDIEGEVALCVAALDVVRSDKNVQLVLSSNDIDAVMLALACTELPLDTIVMRSNRMPAQTTTLNQAKEEFDFLVQKSKIFFCFLILILF